MAKSGLFKHWTENDRRTMAFVEKFFGDKAVNRKSGADLQVGGLRVEVKAAQEWCVTACANGARRRGRFLIRSYNQADFFLFVLVRDGGKLEFCALEAKKVHRTFGQSASIRWSQIFA
jgi:hypothetical protein